MRITYSAGADALAVELAPEAKSARTIAFAPDVRIDVDAGGRVIAIEILNASVHYGADGVKGLETPVELLTVLEAAKESGLSPTTLRLQLSAGRIKGVKRGRDWMVPRHELWNYLDNRDPGGRPPASRKARKIRRSAKKEKTIASRQA